MASHAVYNRRYTHTIVLRIAVCVPSSWGMFQLTWLSLLGQVWCRGNTYWRVTMNTNTSQTIQFYE